MDLSLNTCDDTDEEDHILTAKYTDDANKQLQEIFRNCNKMKQREKQYYRFGQLLYPNTSSMIDDDEANDPSPSNFKRRIYRFRYLGIAAVVLFCSLNLYNDVENVFKRANAVMMESEKRSKDTLRAIPTVNTVMKDSKTPRSMAAADDPAQKPSEESGVAQSQSQEGAINVYDKPLFKALHDVNTIPDGKTHVGQFPFFWQTLPDVKRGYRQGWFLDNCFDLTRANVVGPNGSHKITFMSKSAPFPQEDIIVASNIFEVPKLFKPEETHHQRGLMISLIAHPVQRAALIFDYLRKTTKDPGYDPRIANLDLAAYAKLLLSDDDSLVSLQLYRMSNWLTRSLSFAGPNDVLTEKHLEEATLALKERCFVGLFDEVEESMKRFQRVLGVKAPDQAATNSCFKNYASEALVPLVREESEEWTLLEQLNSLDIQLYENAKQIFVEQGKNLFSEKKQQEARKLISDKLDKASNRLYPVFRDVNDVSAVTTGHEEDFPFFWETFPQAHGRKELLWFSDHCFDLTRSKVIGANGAHQIVYTSQKNPIFQETLIPPPQKSNISSPLETTTSSLQESVISAYNLLESINIFHERDTNHRAARLFAFFLHPVHRAALLFEHYRISSTEPDYDTRVRTMSLEQFAKFMIEDKDIKFFKTIRFKISNYLTRILTGVPFPEPLTGKHVELAANFLQEKCVIGLVDEMEESLHRVKNVLDIKDKTREEKQATNECFWEFMSEPIVPNSVEEGSEAWNLLAKLNDADMILYQKIKNLFAEQGNTMFVDLEYTQMRVE